MNGPLSGLDQILDAIWPLLFCFYEEGKFWLVVFLYAINAFCFSEIIHYFLNQHKSLKSILWSKVRSALINKKVTYKLQKMRRKKDMFCLKPYWVCTSNSRNIWVFHPIFVTWFLVVFDYQVTKILHNGLFTFFTEQGKTGKNWTHENENFATYFWYLGSFDENRIYENM